MAKNYDNLDPKVAKGFYFAKMVKGGKVIKVTRIHPDKVKEYEKAGWKVEKPVDVMAVPEDK